MNVTSQELNSLPRATLQRDASEYVQRVIRTISLLAAALAFVIHYRFVLQHFSNGPYLFDSGWFAYLLDAGDPRLTDPRAIDSLTFLDYHLVPYFSALAMLSHWLGVDGFHALALHQGLIFALLTATLCLVASNGPPTKDRAIAVLAAAGFGLTSELVLQAAGFPHLEIAMPALGLVISLLVWHGHYRATLLPFLATCACREDGGFFAAYSVVAPIVLRDGKTILEHARLYISTVVYALSGVFIAVLMFVAERLYGRLSIFNVDFSGDGWRHLNPLSVVQRTFFLAHEPQFIATLVGLAVLSFFSFRYIVFFVLALPLFFIQLIAARQEVWSYTLYYDFPWLLTWFGVFFELSRRIAGRRRWKELAVVVTTLIVTSSPFISLLGLQNGTYIVEQGLFNPIVNLSALRSMVNSALQGQDNICVSGGVAGLTPNSVDPKQILSDRTSDITPCQKIFLFRYDMWYGELRSLVLGSNFRLVSELGSRVEIYSR